MGGKNSYESIKRYEDKAYDKVLVRLPKGKKSKIAAHLQSSGESVNGFINRAIHEAMEQDANEKTGTANGRKDAQQAMLYELRRLIKNSGKESYTIDELCDLLDTIADAKAQE